MSFDDVIFQRIQLLLLVLIDVVTGEMVRGVVIGTGRRVIIVIKEIVIFAILINIVVIIVPQFVRRRWVTFVGTNFLGDVAQESLMLAWGGRRTCGVGVGRFGKWT